MKQQSAQKVFEGKRHTPSTYAPTITKPLWPILGIIIIIALVAFGATQTSWFETNSEDTDNSTSLVKVNDDIITANQLDAQWNSLSPMVKMQVNRSQVLESLIETEILLDRAQELGITTSSREAKQYLRQTLTSQGMSYEQYASVMETQGIDMDYVVERYRQQLTLSKLIAEEGINAEEPSEEDVETYYNEHNETFYHNEMVRVRHILIEINNQTNESRARNLTENILERITTQDNVSFCDMVEEYSMDLGSVDQCGEYTFGRGRMVPEFENASFTMDVGEYEQVKSQFGIHLIEKLEDIPSGYYELDDMYPAGGMNTTVRQFIERTVQQEASGELFEEYVQALRETANITYMNVSIATENTNSEQLVEVITSTQENTTNETA